MMAKRNQGMIVICPSRGRPEAVLELCEAFQDTCTRDDTTLMVVVDADDPEKERYRLPDDPTFHLWIRPNTSMVAALNDVALHLATAHHRPFAIGFMGDDHRPRTADWDEIFMAELEAMGTGIVYGNDLLQGEKLATHVAMTANIIRTLGYMAPPELQHMFVDNAWIELGRAINRIKYLPAVTIEHMHPVAGKAEWDPGYVRVNDPGVYARDGALFERWRLQQLPLEAARLRRLP